LICKPQAKDAGHLQIQHEANTAPHALKRNKHHT